MKTIKTGFGIKRIGDCEESVLLLQVRDLLSTHRGVLIQRLISDLPTYIEYTFNVKAQVKQLQEIKERLYELKNSSVELDVYPSIVQDVLANKVIHIINGPFYKEINDCIGWYFQELPLTLVK